jgi:hypothetical protein
MIGAVAIRSWPVLPFTDYRFVRLASSFPLATVTGRRLQFEIVCRKFPQLAQVALDRNSLDTRSVMTEYRASPAMNRVAKLKAEVMERLRRRLGMAEVRAYRRTFDWNSPGWLEIRDLCQGAFDACGKWINPAVARGLVPASTNTDAGRVPNPIVDTAGRKMLMAAALWLRRFDF